MSYMGRVSWHLVNGSSAKYASLSDLRWITALDNPQEETILTPALLVVVFLVQVSRWRVGPETRSFSRSIASQGE